MTDNVIHRPRPREQRGICDGLAFHVRGGFIGLVIDATNGNRHRGLIAEARRRDSDGALDRKTQAMGTVDGYKQTHGSVPLGLDGDPVTISNGPRP